MTKHGAIGIIGFHSLNFLLVSLGFLGSILIHSALPTTTGHLVIHDTRRTLYSDDSKQDRQHSLLFTIRFGFSGLASRIPSIRFDITRFPIGATANVSVVKVLINCINHVLGIYTRCTLVLGVAYLIIHWF